MGALDAQVFDADTLVSEIWADNFMPRVPRRVDDWADANRILPEGSAEPGPWKTARIEAARQIYHDLSDDNDFEDIILMCAVQLLKSEAGLNWMGWIIDENPGPAMIVQATVNTAKRYSRMRVAPMITACPSLNKKISKTATRDAANSTSYKEYPGGPLVITGSNSPAELASMPMKYIHFDEVDDYQFSIGGQGDPRMIAVARQDSHRRRKRLHSSSPKRPKGQSPIEIDFLAGTQFRRHVPCPHCGHYQVLYWKHMEWLSDPEPRPESAMYRCQGPGCNQLISEHHKVFMFANAVWIAAYPERRKRSYHLSSLYSPLGWLSWSSMVTEWLEALADKERGDHEKYITFVNTRLAETVAEQAESIAANDLIEKAPDYPIGIVPMGGLIVLVAVDTQDDRLECAAWAFGMNDQKWLVETVKIMGNPGENDTWEKLDTYLQTRYPHASGQTLQIEAVGIDTGGHYTHSVYNYVRLAHPSRKIAALRGDNHKAGMPIMGRASNVDVNWKGGVIKGGVKLWTVGVNTAKDVLHNQLKIPGLVNVSKHFEPEIFNQLVAEKRVMKKTARGMRYVWEKPHSNTRNEQLDMAVMAMWCAERVGLSKWPKKIWERLQERVQPISGGLFDQPVQGATSTVQPTSQQAQPAVRPRAPARPQRASGIPRSSLLGKLRSGR